MLNKYNFTLVYDLQNSSRTKFYRKFLLNSPIWSSSSTALDVNQKKSDFDNEPILERFKIQLNKSGIKAKYTLHPDFSWAAINIDRIINKYFNKKFIILFPFCSPQLPHKKWPYFNDLIKLIKIDNPNLEIITAPAFSELKEAEKIKCKIITNNNKQLSITELTGLIKKASYVIANDTGPAHIAAHLGKKGVTFFGHHTTAKKVSIETNNFKAIKVDDLSTLSAKHVYSKIKGDLNLIN
jgi:ADP-heptose:LPS heptosyltransferase